MSKLICDICGTSYPDTATQCPICGCVRPAESAAVEDSDQEDRGYTYVKGGRFSKANVKKRNSSAAHAAGKAASKSQGENGSSSGKVITLVIVLVLLLLIVLSMIGFIAFTLIGDFDLFGNGNTSQSETAEIPCTGITLSKAELSFAAEGEEYTLNTICAPVNTTDAVVFSSSDETVATVSKDGKVVCVGPGEAVIYVYCGEQKDECLVKCSFEEETEPPTETEPKETVSVKLSRENITDANFPGYSWDLYEPGDVKAEELTWVSDDPAVATVSSKGVVTAVAEGSTVIRVYYNDEEVASCAITCDFSQQEEMTPDEGNYVPYTIYGPVPYEDGRDCYSMTLKLNEWVGLFLRDPENPDNTVKVVWTIVEGECQIDSDGAGVKATSERNCKIKAEYNGQIYYILIY